VNLLVYAYAARDPRHARAAAWWSAAVSREQVALPWAVVLGFLRLVTTPAVVERPAPADRVLATVEGWLARSNVQVLEPGPRHLSLLRALLAEAGTAGRLTSDAHLAALAIEHQCTLHSNDADFGRFSGLRWVNPLA
jgi:toxin-antitoxin system PIN domain toxin